MSIERRTMLLAVGVSVLVHLILCWLLARLEARTTPMSVTGQVVEVDAVEEEEEAGEGRAYLAVGSGKWQGEVPAEPRPAQQEVRPPGSVAAAPFPAVPPPQAPVTAPTAPLAQPHAGIGPEFSPLASGTAEVAHAGGGNGPAGAFFGVAPSGQRVVYVLDRSSSMGLAGALDRAAAELLASLRSLPPSARFQIIVYNSTASTLLPQHPDWLPPTGETLAEVAAALQTLVPEGGTRHQLALPLALSLLPDVVFFLTDADDLPAGHVTEVTQSNAGRAVIHTIELTTRHAAHLDMPLQRLARQNRGQYRAVPLGG